MRSVRLVLVACVGCSFPEPRDIPDARTLDAIVPGDDATAPGDALLQRDASVGFDAPVCFGNFLRLCLDRAPTESLDLKAPATIDTSQSSMCVTVANHDKYCVIAATDIRIEAPLRGTGTRALVLLATGTISTSPSGLIDVGSHRVRSQGTPEIGAGADPSECNVGELPSGVGGGAGGSFVGRGGFGGYNEGASSAGGSPAPVANAISELRGGCPGQDGGFNAGSKGHGGGAVLLIAGTSIAIDGMIKATGEGGGGSDGGAGGGGGSGGMIALEAPTINVTNLVLASGGGGGAGGGLGAGQSGSDPLTANAAPGGSSMGQGGPGGNGSKREIAGSGDAGTEGFNSDLASGGGGGGGGGAGIIKALSTATFTADVSPPVAP
jgi:hypothetical protein